MCVGLTACGGGGGARSAQADATEIILLSGDSTTVAGSIQTDAQLLKSVAWQITAANPGSETVVVSNDKCESVSKLDKPFVPATGTPTTRTGSSNWSCGLGVIAPTSVSADRLFTLVLTGVDDKGGSQTLTKKLRVKQNPDPTTTFTKAAGQDFSVTAGDSVNLACAGDATNKYQWAIVANGGKSVSLAAMDKQTTTFQAPVVTADTVVTAQCRTTLSTGKVEVSNVNVTVKPAAANVLTTKITGLQAVKPGGKLSLVGASQWFTATGQTTSGHVSTFAWTLDSTAPAGVVIMNPSAETTEVNIPSSVTTTVSFPVKLTVTSGSISKEVSGTILVDPVSALSPAVDPAAQAVKSGEVAKMEVTASGGTNLFYKWTVLSGPSVPLGGNTTSQASFVAPTVEAPIDIVLRVAIGYEPISTAKPGIYFVDTVVNVKPNVVTP